MAATGAATILDGWRVPSALGPGTYEEYLITFAGGSAVTDYATGGQTFTMPAELHGAQFVSLDVISVNALTRTWVWDGSQATPKVKALDSFATEEGNATTVNSDTLTCLLRVKR